MTFSFRLDSVELSDGSQFNILPEGVTAIVGPNNAGKSRLLREVAGSLHDNSPRLIAKNVSLHREGSQEEVLGWLSSAAIKRFRNGNEFFFLEGQQMQVDHSFSWMTGGPPLAGGAHGFVLRLLDAQSRLQLSNASTSFHVAEEPPTNSLQRMFVDPALELTLSDAFKEAFGDGLVLNRLGGNQIELYVGDPIDVAIADVATYLAEIATRKPMREQGDGVRSYVGLLLAALAAPWPILMIDEPEAFLHPPQARALGRRLATLAAGQRQVLIATHSADIIRGLLDGPAGSVSINRMTRDGDVNHMASLDAGQVSNLWDDPLLRFSNILDGLFHPTVVLCESDADCRFYEAVLASQIQVGELPNLDWLFVHCGGKHRMPDVLSALQAVRVPTLVIADIDVLRDEAPLPALLDLLGIDAGACAPLLNSVRAGAVSLTPQNPAGHVRGQIEGAFQAHQGPNMTPQLQSQIRDLTRSGDGWSLLKRGGSQALPQGQAAADCQALLGTLAAGGLYVVPVGELERWDAAIPGHGPGWTAAALEAGAHQQAGSPAWNFIKSIAVD